MNGLNMQQNPSGVAMDVLDNLMSNSSSSAAGPASLPAPGSQPAQQMLMEQQMRLNQLQQLYQLQTQIFQQQVSTAALIRHSATATFDGCHLEPGGQIYCADVLHCVLTCRSNF